MCVCGGGGGVAGGEVALRSSMRLISPIPLPLPVPATQARFDKNGHSKCYQISAKYCQVRILKQHQT